MNEIHHRARISECETQHSILNHKNDENQIWKRNNISFFGDRADFIKSCCILLFLKATCQLS